MIEPTLSLPVTPRCNLLPTPYTPKLEPPPPLSDRGKRSKRRKEVERRRRERDERRKEEEKKEWQWLQDLCSAAASTTSTFDPISVSITNSASTSSFSAPSGATS